MLIDADARQKVERSQIKRCVCYFACLKSVYIPRHSITGFLSLQTFWVGLMLVVGADRVLSFNSSAVSLSQGL